MIVCRHCGFKMCNNVENGLECYACEQEHNFRHDDWAEDQMIKGVPEHEIPDAEWINTSVSDNYFLAWFGFLGRNKNYKLCAWCEEKVDTANHYCQKINESVDCKSFINKLKDKK